MGRSSDAGAEPKLALEPSTTSVVSEVGRGLKSGFVLLADDEPAVRSVGQRMLERIGFEVVVAADGREAVEIFGACSDRVVLVVLDVTMPHLDGSESFREIRRIRPDVPVVLTSGYSEDEAMSRFAGTGLAGFIQKPFRLASIRSVVMGALERSSEE